MAEVTTGLYPFDPTGTSPDNHVVNEKQTLVAPAQGDFYFIIPKAAPFFTDGFEIVNDSTNQPFVYGEDYEFGHRFVEAMDGIGKEVVGSIRFFDRTIAGIARLEYQTLGGNWGFDAQTVTEELGNTALNPLIRTWGQVAPIPATFPPIAHDQQVDTLVGSDALKAAIDALTAAVVEASAGASQDHLLDFDNPHQVSADDVELGAVDNFPTATKAQAESGLNGASFMTPQRTTQAIQVQALVPLNAHVNDESNPHNTTKDDVQLGNLQNYPVANEQQALDGVRNDLYVTVLRVQQMIDANDTQTAVNQIAQNLQNHIQDYNNPHRVTAAQSGAYTTDEVDQLMTTVTAQNTPRFAGKTETEWRDSLPSFDDITEILETLQDEYSQAQADVDSVSEQPVEQPNRPRYPQGAILGPYRYGVIYPDYLVEVPGPNLVPETADYSVLCYGDGFAYMLGSDGYVYSYGVAPWTVPPEFEVTAGMLPSPAPIDLRLGRYAAFFILDDGSALGIGDAGHPEAFDIPSAKNVSVVDVAVGWTANSIIRHLDGTVEALGNANFITNADAVLSGLTAVRDVCIGEDAFFVHFEDDTLRGWNITDPEGSATVAEITLPAEQSTNIQSVSGVYRHYLILGADGTVYARGDTDLYAADITDIDGPYTLVQAGKDYSITRSIRGDLWFWGDDPTNEYLMPGTVVVP